MRLVARGEGFKWLRIGRSRGRSDRGRGCASPGLIVETHTQCTPMRLDAAELVERTVERPEFPEILDLERGRITLELSGNASRKYSKNGGAFTNVATTVQNGDTMRLQVRSSASTDSTKNATLSFKNSYVLPSIVSGAKTNRLNVGENPRPQSMSVRKRRTMNPTKISLWAIPAGW